MTTLAQDGLPVAKTVLKTLVAEFDTLFGLYARVVSPGLIRQGDGVSVR
jgi:MOSC domain-containing protein YiiM